MRWRSGTTPAVGLCNVNLIPLSLVGNARPAARWLKLGSLHRRPPLARSRNVGSKHCCQVGRGGRPSPAALHAVYALLIYITGFAAWEFFALTSSVVGELPRLADARQVELGLAAVASGLAS